MAKQRMITRTALTTKATVLCLNTETAEPFNETVLLSGTYKDAKNILKDAKKLLDNDTISVCKVVNIEVEEKLYGMPEVEFLQYAKVLPPRNINKNANSNT